MLGEIEGGRGGYRGALAWCNEINAGRSKPGLARDPGRYVVPAELVHPIVRSELVGDNLAARRAERGREDAGTGLVVAGGGTVKGRGWWWG